MGDKLVATMSSRGYFDLLDEDDMASDSQFGVPTQQSVKSYVDDAVGVGEVTEVDEATYDILAGDSILHVIRTATGAAALTLLTAQAVNGRTIVVKDAGGLAGTNNITIDTEGGETIDGAATAVITSNYTSLSLYSDGTDWFIY